jgi:hypothetical protein
MIPGLYPVASQPNAALADSDQDATAPALLSLGEDRIYLVEAMPYDPDLGAVVTLRFADRAFITKPSDDPANTPYPAAVETALEFERSIFAGADIGGRSSRGVGDVVLLNGDGALDGILDHAFDGREVTVRVGAPGAVLTDFSEILRGTAQGISWTPTEIRIQFRDKAALLDVPVQPALYAGTGGLEGGDDVKGRPKVRCYGVADNVTAVLLDAATRLYQVNDGPVSAIRAVYDKGSALTEVAAAPGVGEYTVSLAAGTFTLGGDPVGTVTADVDGDATGGTFVSSAAAIAKRVARVALADGEIDEGSFNVAANTSPAPVGLTITDGRSVAEMLSELALTIGGYWGFSRVGQLELTVFAAPAAAADFTFTDADIIEIERLPTPPPLWRRRIAWGRNWTVQAGDALAEGVSTERRGYLAEPFRTATAAAATVKTRHLLAGDPETVTALFAEEADAQAEADRQLALYRVTRDLYRVVARRPRLNAFGVGLGDTVAIRSDRFGLTAVAAAAEPSGAVTQLGPHGLPSKPWGPFTGKTAGDGASSAAGKHFRVTRLRQTSRENVIEMELFG